MNKHFAITIDVEADDLWSGDSAISCTNIPALQRFHTLARTYAYKPTYLISYEVLQDRAALRVINGIQEDGGCEIGAHLHPWLTPPYGKNEDGRRTYAFELSKDAVEAKLERLGSEIQEKCRVAPRSYRAGAWGFGRVNAELLIKQGYLVDCSITPRVTWENNVGFSSEGKDFRRFGPRPFLIHNENGHILEVPVSIYVRNESLMNIRVFRYAYCSLAPQNPFNKFLRLLGLRPIWLRPLTNSDFEKFKKIHELATSKGIDVLEMMFHSSELMAGTNRNFKTEADTSALFVTLEKFFSYLKERGFKGTTLCDYYTVAADSKPEGIDIRELP